MASLLSRIPRETRVAAAVLGMALVQVGVLAALGLERAERSRDDVELAQVEDAERSLKILGFGATERIATQEAGLVDAMSRDEAPLAVRVQEARRRAPLFTGAFLVGGGTSGDGGNAAGPTVRDARRAPFAPPPSGRVDPAARTRLDEILELERTDPARAIVAARALADDVERAAAPGAADVVAAALALEAGARAALVRGDLSQALELSRRLLDRYRLVRDDRGALAEREPLGVSAAAIACEALMRAAPKSPESGKAAFVQQLSDRRTQLQRMGDLVSSSARQVEIDECRRMRREGTALSAAHLLQIDEELRLCASIDEGQARIETALAGPLRTAFAAAVSRGEAERLALPDGALLAVIPAPQAAPWHAVVFVAEPAALRAAALLPALEHIDPPRGVRVLVRDAAGAVVAGDAAGLPPRLQPTVWQLGKALPGLRAEAYRVTFSEETETARSYWVWVLVGAGLAVLAASLLAIRTVLREVRLARMKSDFVSNLSHELRTPLTSLRMFVETLQEGRVKDEQEAKECLDVVAQETARLSSFVDRILTFASFEKGRAPIDMRDEDAGDVVRRAAEVFRKRAEAAGARIELELTPALPPARLDRDAIIQVLLNLLDNAVKHGGDKGRVIRLSVRADGAGTAILVEDDGPGVPERERDLVFEEFYRGDDTLSRRTEGTGIGLALCRRIVLAHGGRIDVSKSKSLGGAAFKDPAARRRFRAGGRFQGSCAMTKILVVEDDPSILLGLSKNLTFEGYEVIQAKDGELGLELAFSEKPDLIVLDLMLPGCNGYEICRAVRKHDAAVPILMLSAKGMEQDKVTGLDLGADDYVSKPFSVKEVMARVRALLRKRRVMEGESEAYKFGSTEIDFTARLVRVDGRVVETSKKEFELLRLFIKNRGRVLSRDQILNHVWGYDYDGTPRTIDNFVQKLREKVEKDPDAPEHIRTIRGVGYLFDGPAPKVAP